MAGQGIERREVLRIMALAAAASKLPVFQKWAFAQDGTAATPKPPYQPQFFSPEEYATIERLAELIIPSDETPGAGEAGASEFIDFIVASDPEIQPRFRYGVGWIDAHARFLHGRGFRECTDAEQTEMLECLAYPRRYRPGEEDGRAFFSLMRDYTVMAFYTSRIGLEELNYPGLRMYAESPGCSNPNDPGHRHRRT